MPIRIGFNWTMTQKKKTETNQLWIALDLLKQYLLN